MRFMLSVVGAIIVAVFMYYYTNSRLDSSPAAPIEVELGDLVARQSVYEGRRVRVAGVVAENAGMLGVGAYRLVSGTSGIVVVSIGGIPAMGATVTVQGTFKQAFSMNSLTYTVILEE